MSSKDMKVGEIRKFEGKQYRCVLQKELESDCAFWTSKCGAAMECLGNCTAALRRDKTDIIFVKVDEEEK